jgi:hypothetical protein
LPCRLDAARLPRFSGFMDRTSGDIAAMAPSKAETSTLSGRAS